MYNSPEAQLAWRKVVENPNSSDADLKEWYVSFWNKYTGNLRDLMIPQMIADYRERMAKLAELGQDGYNSWMEARTNRIKAEFIKANPDYLKEGQRSRNNDATFEPDFKKVRPDDVAPTLLKDGTVVPHEEVLTKAEEEKLDQQIATTKELL
jgi:hypothetical protein